MLEKKQIEDIVKEAISTSDIFLVDVVVNRNNGIQVFIDHNAGISLDDCARVHQIIESQLDRDKEDFDLQVSSPGLGQPIRVFPQYVKAVGQKLSIVLEDGEIIKGILREARSSDVDREAELVISIAGTKRKPAPEEPIILKISRIKTARVEIDFKQE